MWRTTFEACRRAGIVAVSALQLKPIEKMMMKLTTKSQIESRQARYYLIVVQMLIVIESASLAANLLLAAVLTTGHNFNKFFLTFIHKGHRHFL